MTQPAASSDRARVATAASFLATACVAALCFGAGCATSKPSVGNLARASITTDFESYHLRRVGLLPFQGEMLDGGSSAELQGAFTTELAQHAHFEVVPLSPSDLEEVPHSEPFRRGRIQPSTVLALARRFRLDGIFLGTVSELRCYQPQRLGVELDLIASETGVCIWSSSAQLDAADERTRLGLQQWWAKERGLDAGGEPPDVYLLSPRRFAQFAAAQMARLL